MASPWQSKLGAFDVALRPQTRMRWPSAVLHPEDRIELEPGAGDLLILGHAPSRHFSGREPIHQSLMIELARPLAESTAGALALDRVAYRAGAERLAYQTTSAAGTVILLEARADGYELSVELMLLAPELGLELGGAGSRQLSGVIFVPRG